MLRIQKMLNNTKNTENFKNTENAEVLNFLKCRNTQILKYILYSF